MCWNHEGNQNKSGLLWCISKEHINKSEVYTYQLLSNRLNLFLWKAFIVLKHFKQFSLRQAFSVKLADPNILEPIRDEKAQSNQTELLHTWANSVTTQNSWGVSKASIISIMFSCLSFLRIYIRSCGWQQKVRWYSEIRKKTAVVTSISCLRLCISLSVLPCLRMNFMATVWTETQNRRKQRVSSINYKGREWESIT